MFFWSEAIYCLRLTSEQFWRLTPAQFFELEKRYLDDIKLADYRASLTPCIISNMFSKKGAKKIEPKDFFPSLAEKKRKPKPKVMTPDEIKTTMRTIAKQLGPKPRAR